MKHGFDKNTNKGEVYLKLISSQLLSFGGEAKGDKAGAIITPDFMISGLSRVYGPVGDELEEISNHSKINPAKYFFESIKDQPKDLLEGAKLLGGVLLSDILGEVSDLNPLDHNDNRIPRLVSEVRGNQQITEFIWETSDFKETEIFVHQDTTKLSVRATSMADIPEPGHKPKAPETHTFAEINDFKINIFSYIVLNFDQISFESWNGKKPDLNVSLNKLEPVSFGRELAFVNDLKKYIPIDGFSDPPNLDITERGIVASYSLALPDITLGVFSLRYLSLGAG